MVSKLFHRTNIQCDGGNLYISRGVCSEVCANWVIVPPPHRPCGSQAIPGTLWVLCILAFGLLSGQKLDDLVGIVYQTLVGKIINLISVLCIFALCCCLLFFFLPGYSGIFKMIPIPTAGFSCRRSVWEPLGVWNVAWSCTQMQECSFTPTLPHRVHSFVSFHSQKS